MKKYPSSEALFGAITTLADQLEQSGGSGAATELHRDLGCLNGLTDGWALLMDSYGGYADPLQG